jgi:LmbE family N-acetylglucosaminyl deacetylase
LSLAWQSNDFQRQIMTFNGEIPNDHSDTSDGDTQPTALTAEYFDIAPVSSIDQIDFDATPMHTEQVVQINQYAANGAFYDGGKTDNFAVQYRGEFQIANAGDYTFYLSSDDGSELSIDGEVIIDNDGLHGNIEQSARVTLTQGMHQIQIRYFDRTEHATLSLAWQSNDFHRQIMTFNGEGPIQHSFTSGGDMQIVAHQDDDILFMNPDINTSIAANRPLTTVYVTAGDAALGESYWRSRESGGKAAYAYMAGVDGWVDDRISVTKNGQNFELSVAYLLDKPYIQLVFLRLPDGFRSGSGSGVNNGESLQKLYQYSINSIGALDGSNRYSRDDLISVIQGLLDAYKPLNVRIHDHESAYAYNEHSDHVYSAMFSADAVRDNDAGLYLKSYINYETESFTVNLTASEINLTRETFLKYAAFDGEVWQANGQLIDVYSEWVKRQYLAYEIEINPYLIGTNEPSTTTQNQPQASNR